MEAENKRGDIENVIMVINLHESSNFLFKLIMILSDTVTHTKRECYDEGGQIP